MEGGEEMLDISPSPIDSPRGPDGPVSADQSFLCLPVTGAGGEVVAEVGGGGALKGFSIQET
eukprot:12011567-Karenia_brevis.AAC.1